MAPPGCESHTMRSSRGNAIGYYLLPTPATAGRKRPQPVDGVLEGTPDSTGRRLKGRGPADRTPQSDGVTPTPPTAGFLREAGAWTEVGVLPHPWPYLLAKGTSDLFVGTAWLWIVLCILWWGSVKCPYVSPTLSNSPAELCLQRQCYMYSCTRLLIHLISGKPL